MSTACRRRTERLGVFVVAVFSVGLAFAALAGAATRYDSRLRFRTISTVRFDIHFHQREESLARRLAAMVEAIADEVDAAIGAPTGRVQVILVDQHDLSNGWATPLPYNTIEISAAAPPADSQIGNTDDWLRLVFTHEYTHIAHLSRAGGWIAGLRRGFGRLPVLFPNLYQPLWGIEGIATWQESASTGHGRVPTGDFRMVAARASLANRFEPMDRVGGGNVDWPAGNGPYVYGAYFHQYLAERYGAPSVRSLAQATSRQLPYFGPRAYRAVYGESLGRLWADFESHIASTAATADTAVAARRLTSHGFRVGAPRHAPDGRILYSVSNPRGFPALMEIDPSSGAPRRIASRYLGNRIAIAGKGLIVDEIDLVRSVALISDLYLVDPRTGARQQLTREARALDPDYSVTSDRGVCTLQMSDRRALATFVLGSGDDVVVPEVLISEAGTDFAAPAWSPDGRVIAAERRRLGGASEIVVVDPADGRVRVVAALPGGRSASPSWTRDGASILFSSAVPDAAFQLYRVDVESGAIVRLEGTGPSAQSPDVSPDGRSVVFIGYTADGYDLFSMDLSAARWIPVASEPTTRTDEPPVPSAAPGGDDHPYDPLRTLVPQFWTPTVESDAGEVVVGAATGGIDALGRHAFVVEAGWSTRTRPDWQVAYAYDRWRPTVFASFADDTDPWRGGELREREANVGMLLRVARVRWSHTTFASFHVADVTIACPACAVPGDVNQRRASVRLGWDVRNARSFGYSISAEEGGSLKMTAEFPCTALGSDGNGRAFTIDARRYWRAWPRHGVVAARVAASSSFGDSSAQRTFGAGGHGPQTAGFGFGVDAIGLLRGFDDDALTGTRAAVVNLDYRAPLRRIDRGLGTLPFFVRLLHGALFVDAGQAWTERARWRETRAAFGGELSADVVLGFTLPLTLTAGAAWHRDPANGGMVAFGRIGRAF
jgi:hypothetical protein